MTIGLTKKLSNRVKKVPG